MNERHKRFCQEYLIDLNAEKAALRAGYSASVARSRHADIVGRPDVQAEIARLLAERRERTKIDADEILEEIADVALATVADVAEWDGEGLRIVPSANLGRRGKRAIAEVIQETTRDGGTRLRVKMHPKVSALELAGRHLGLFLDRTKIEGELAIDLSREEADAYKARLRAMTPEELDAELAKKAR